MTSRKKIKEIKKKIASLKRIIKNTESEFVIAVTENELRIWKDRLEVERGG